MNIVIDQTKDRTVVRIHLTRQERYQLVQDLIANEFAPIGPRHSEVISYLAVRTDDNHYKSFMIQHTVDTSESAV